MIGLKPENERTDKMDRQQVLNQVLDYAKSKASQGSHYAYAFGMISVLLTDNQLKDLERVTK
jgi:hypothetical protein